MESAAWSFVDDSSAVESAAWSFVGDSSVEEAMTSSLSGDSAVDEVVASSLEVDSIGAETGRTFVPVSHVISSALDVLMRHTEPSMRTEPDKVRSKLVPLIVRV